MMSARSPRSFSAALGDFLSFTGYVQVTSTRPLNECIYALRESRGRVSLLGGFNTRLVLPKKATGNEWRFEIEYYRQSRRSSRSSHMVQRLQGMMYQEGNQTHVVAKVHFTGAALRWLWLALALTVVSIGLPLYTGKPILFMMLVLTGPWLLAIGLVMWLDRYKLVRLVRRSMSE
jgi:hypothetical protein